MRRALFEGVAFENKQDARAMALIGVCRTKLVYDDPIFYDCLYLRSSCFARENGILGQAPRKRPIISKNRRLVKTVGLV